MKCSRPLYELRCDPFGGVLDRGRHAHRAVGMLPDRAAAGQPAVAGPVASACHKPGMRQLAWAHYSCGTDRRASKPANETAVKPR